MEDPACPVDYHWLLLEIRAADDKTRHPQKLLNPVKVSERELQHRKRVERAHTGSLGAFLQ
jgi:hypothetical protein